MRGLGGHDANLAVCQAVYEDQNIHIRVLVRLPASVRTEQTQLAETIAEDRQQPRLEGQEGGTQRGRDGGHAASLPRAHDSVEGKSPRASLVRGLDPCVK